MVLTCSICGDGFDTAHGLNVHVGKQHRAPLEDSPSPKRPCVGPGPWVGPHVGPNDSDGEDIALPELFDDEPGHTDARQEASRSARRHARATLVSPQWEQWARDLRLEAEATCLTAVEALYTAPARCPNKETHRYATLMALHPGAAFHKALLKADREEELLLSKALPPKSQCMITHVWNIPGIFHTCGQHVHAFPHLEYLRNIPCGIFLKYSI